MDLSTNVASTTFLSCQCHNVSKVTRSIPTDDPVYTLEMCMTQLDREQASIFYKGNMKSAGEMTLNSGIRDILPGSVTCDFEFDPCGYSMNAIEGD
ncbi:hypothetical protein KI387_015560, partial [Taxus chinensis]